MVEAGEQAVEQHVVGGQRDGLGQGLIQVSPHLGEPLLAVGDSALA